MDEYLRTPSGYNTNYVSMPKNKRKRESGPETTAQGTQRLEWMKGAGVTGDERLPGTRPKYAEYLDVDGAPARDVYAKQQRGGVRGTRMLPTPPSNAPSNKLNLSDFYAQITANAAKIAAIKQQQQQAKLADNPVSRPVLDEEIKSPNSNRNPSNVQAQTTDVNPVKTPGSAAVPKGNDFSDTGTSPLAAYENASTADPAPKTAEGSNIIRSKGKGSVHVITDGSTATLTNEEFSRAKISALGADADKGGANEKPTTALAAQQDKTPTVPPSDPDPATTYSPPTTAGVIPVTQGSNTGRWMEGGDVPSSAGAGAGGSDTIHSAAKGSDKNMGLLGLGALLGSAFIVYGTTEGLSSQYVVGASALTAYCMTHVLGLNV